jgi:autotransporter-associated beta strand protein
MPPLNAIGLLFPFVLALLCVAVDLPAGTSTWDGGGVDDNLTTSANWAGNTAPNFSATSAETGDNLIFGGSTRLKPLHDTQSGINNAQTAFTITFAANAGPFVITGNKITLGSMTGNGGSGGSITNLSAATQTFLCDVAPRTGSIIAQAGDLVLNGSFSVGNNSNTRTNIVDGTFNTYINGQLSSAGCLVKNGAGTLYLGNLGSLSNDFSGWLKINAGSVTLGTNAVLPASSITVAVGATFDVSRVADGFNLQTNQVIGGPGAIKGRLVAGPGVTVALTGSGGLNLAGSVMIGTDGMIKANGVSGSSVLINTGISQLALQGTTWIEWRKTGGTVTNGLVQGATNLVFGGTLVLSNTGPSVLSVGDSLKLFAASNYSGYFDIILPPTPGAGLVWDTSQLAVNGRLMVASHPNLSATSSSPGNTINLTINAASGQTFSLRTTTNLALPFAQWPTVTNATNTAFPPYPLVFSQQVSPNESARFYSATSPPSPYSQGQIPLYVNAARKPTNAFNPFATRTLEQLPGFVTAGRDAGLSQYGGLLSRQTNATGYFYTRKIDGRWWLVDPEGYLFINRALNQVTRIQSTGADQALTAKFTNSSNWRIATAALFRQYGFNGAGAWSDPEFGAVTPTPLVQTRIIYFLDTYSKTNGGNTASDYPRVFDAAFTNFCNTYANNNLTSSLKTNRWILGYFSDNELPIWSDTLTKWLALPSGNSSGDAAWAWLRARYGAGATASDVTNQDLFDFQGYVFGRYYQVVSQAIKRYDTNHLYLGSRLWASHKNRPEIFRALGPHLDVVSVNLYEYWTPDLDMLAMWERESGRPILISEWYVKGADSGLKNESGLGWVVNTQAERGLFYQNFTLALLQSKVCVGWHWFRYADCDPDDLSGGSSNIDCNKGIVGIRYDPWYPLLDAALQVNERVYRLADYFDGKPMR